jgi:hypothetical protein
MNRKSKERERRIAAKLYRARQAAIPTELEPDEDTAWHEAGHAVMSEVYSFPVTLVSCTPEFHIENGVPFGYKGFTQRDNEVLTDKERQLEFLKVQAAGCAVDRVRGRYKPGTDMERQRTDSDRRLFRLKFSNNADEAFELAVREVAKELSEPQRWAAVSRVASQMFERGKLSGEEVRGIIACSSGLTVSRPGNWSLV